MYLSLVFILSHVVFAFADDSGGGAPLVELNDGYVMPTLALGTWLGNNSMGRIQPEGHEVENAVLWALEAGYRHIDTAWAYMVENQVGSAVAAAAASWDQQYRTTTTPAVCDASCYMSRLKDNIYRATDNVPPVRREDIFITTKLWNDAHARAAVVPALKKSLRQLQLDYVDLYLMHWPLGQFANSSYDYTHYIETWRGMMDAQALNLTRSIGVSNFNLVMLESIRAHQLTKPAVLQIEWNLNLQQPELLAYCGRYNISVMGSSPFGSLWPSRAAAGAPPPRHDHPALLAMAGNYGKTVPQIVLRYALESNVTPIPKSFTPSRIVENVDIFNFELREDDTRVLRAFDRGYRTVPQLKWRDHPYYPFEKVPDTTAATTVTTVSINVTEPVVSVADLNNSSSRMKFIDIKP